MFVGEELTKKKLGGSAGRGLINPSAVVIWKE